MKLVLKKSALRVCAAALAVFLLVGCGAPEGGREAQSGAEAPVSFELIDQPPQIEAPAAERPAVSALSCVSLTSVPELVPLGGNLVVLCTGAYRYDPQTDTETYSTRLQTVDAAADRLLAARELEGSFTAEPRAFSDGRLLLHDYQTNTARVLDSALNELSVIPLPDPWCVFSYDFARLYYVKNAVLYCRELQSGRERAVPLAHGMCVSAIYGIHPTEDLLSVSVYRSPYSSEGCTAAVDGRTGELRVLTDAFHAPSCGEAGTLRAYRYGTRTENGQTYEKQQLIYGDPTDGGLHAVDVDAPLGAWGTWSLLSGSPYALLTLDRVDEMAEDDSLQQSCLCILGDRFALCDLKAYGIEGTLLGGVWLPEAQLVLAPMYGEGGARVYALDPARLDFSDTELAETEDWPPLVDLSLAEAYAEALRKPALPASLADVRARADAIEQRYGVTVLLSAECEAPAAMGSYPVLTTDRAAFSDEEAVIVYALDALETALGRYPDGFFRQFRNGLDGGGVRFLLTGPVTDGSEIIGFVSETAQWNDVTLDCTAAEMEQTVYHELWHAMENHICASHAEMFTDGRWDRCNPEGVLYFNACSEPAPEGAERLRYTYYRYMADKKARTDGIYYVDDYARTDAREDRARIMEFVMGYPDAADIFMQHAPMQQKLSLMCEAVRTAFGTDAWQSVPWERYE